MSSILKVDTIQNTGGTTGLTIDSSGRVTQPALPAWRIGRGSTYTVTSGQAANTDVNFNLTSDTARRFFIQGGCTASSGTVTVPVSGIYSVSTTVRLDAVGSGYVIMQIRINNDSSGSDGSYNIKTGFGSSYHSWSENTIFKLDANDVVRVKYYVSADSNFEVHYLSYFSGFLIG